MTHSASTQRTQLSCREAATFLGINENQMVQWRSRGIGPAYYQYVGRIYYDRADLEAFRESCRREPLSSGAPSAE